MALVGSTLLWLGGPSCMAEEVRRAPVRRSRCARSSLAVDLPGRFIRGSTVFCCRFDESFSGSPTAYRLERLDQCRSNIPCHRGMGDDHSALPRSGLEDLEGLVGTQ